MDQILKLLMLHLVNLELGQTFFVLYLSFHLRLFDFLLLFCFSYYGFRHILAVI